jgi:protein CMS1
LYFDVVQTDNSEHAFCDTSSYQSGRTTDQLPDFLRSFVPGKDFNVAKAPSETGSPHTIVITAAGLRAADLVR